MTATAAPYLAAALLLWWPTGAWLALGLGVVCVGAALRGRWG